MKRLATLLAVAAVVLAAAPARAADEGKDLYAKKCVACHGADGKGTPAGKKMGAKDLATSSLDEAAVAKVIQNGKPPKMPAQKSLTAEQAQAIAKYVKTLK